MLQTAFKDESIMNQSDYLPMPQPAFRMKDKFVDKMMRMAKLIGEDSNPCFSRKVGCVIVDPINNAIRGTGYNGPPPGTPHCDSSVFLREYFWPQLSKEEKQKISNELYGTTKYTDESMLLTDFIEEKRNKGVCPRRYINAGSGARTELCSCGHAERHAITNAECSIRGYHMFVWPLAPCLQCADAIIQAGIDTVHTIEGEQYHKQTEWLFTKASVKIKKYPVSRFCQEPVK
jgi:deoxycytidylate deaminase